jgi:hypothetical protein
MRELEALMKSRFFPDLVNSADVHVISDASMIGLRFKLNNLLNTSPNMLLFYQYGLLKTSDNRFFGTINQVKNLTSNYEFFKFNF